MGDFRESSGAADDTTRSRQVGDQRSGALLHARAAGMRHFEQVVERASAEPRVVRTRSVIVLSRLVHRPDAPPPNAAPCRPIPRPEASRREAPILPT